MHLFALLLDGPCGGANENRKSKIENRKGSAAPGLCHAAIFAWNDLTLDRSRKLVGLQSLETCATRSLQSPAAFATPVGGDSGPNFENCDFFNAQSPVPRHRARCSRPFVASEQGC